MKKFEFTGETKTIQVAFRTVTLHRIRAIVEFGVVRAGDIGGWLEKEENLSQEGKAWVWGNAKVWGDAKVWGNAEVFSVSHVMVIGAIGSRSDFTTFYRGKNKQIMVKCGCFNDTIDKFIEKVQQTHGNNKYALVYRAAVEVAKLQIDLLNEIEFTRCEKQGNEE